MILDYSTPQRPAHSAGVAHLFSTSNDGDNRGRDTAVPMVPVVSPMNTETAHAACYMSRRARFRLEKARRSYLSSLANCSASAIRSSVEAASKNRILAYNSARILRIRVRLRCASAASRANSPIFSLPPASSFAKISMSSRNAGSLPMPVARPWRRAFCRDAARPASERGPVLFLAFLRLAAIFRSDVMESVHCLGEFRIDNV